MQRSENYKTLIFSEMSVEDQERIMELMVNNNVEFEQSQDGNYFATIRLIHRPRMPLSSLIQNANSTQESPPAGTSAVPNAPPRARARAAANSAPPSSATTTNSEMEDMRIKCASSRITTAPLQLEPGSPRTSQPHLLPSPRAAPSRVSPPPLSPQKLPRSAKLSQLLIMSSAVSQAPWPRKEWSRTRSNSRISSSCSTCQPGCAPSE